MASSGGKADAGGKPFPGEPGSRFAAALHRQQPLPLDRSILWSPARHGRRRDPAASFPSFLRLSVLKEIAHHISTPSGDGQLGFLIGELCRCPETQTQYVVVDGIVPAPHAVVGDRTPQFVALAWPRLQERLSIKRRQLIGWYHTHPDGGLRLSAADTEAHLQFFSEAWQMAMVLEPGSGGPRGIICRLAEADPSEIVPLPFYELLERDSARTAGSRPTYISWPDYRSELAKRGRAERSTPVAAATATASAVPPATPTTTAASTATPVAAPRPPDQRAGIRRVMPDQIAHAYEHGVGRGPRRPRSWSRLLAASLLILAVAVFAVWKLSPPRQQRAAQLTEPEPLVLEAADPAITRFDQLGDEAAAALRRYQSAARRFDGVQLSCAELARVFDQTVTSWTAYELEGRAKAGRLDAERAERDQRLYAQMIQVGSHFRATGCRAH